MKSGIHKEYHNGKVIGQGPLVNGKKEGSWEWFHPDNDALWCKGLYENGEKEGLWMNYSLDGDHVTEFRYHKGDLHGPMRSFHKGVMTEQGSYDMGLRQGPWEHFHHNGSIMSRGQYEKGLHDGIWYVFDHDGKLRSTCTFEKGEIVGRETMEEPST